MIEYISMRILGVVPESVGDEIGIQEGDELLSFDGYAAEDILDYEYYNSKEDFLMCVSHNGEAVEYEIDKYADEDLGLVFDTEIPVRVCRNKCTFCFVDQLPKGVRPTLKVKDDDYRHSFISGNYVTLTNVSDADMEKIARLKLLPLYVSVHSTDDSTRRKLLGNPNAPSIMEQLRFLNAAGIKLHAQIVYCPGFNDDVDKTIRDLEDICESLAVVPVGLTEYRNPILSPVYKADAEKVIDVIESNQARILKKKGTRFVFAADELYLKAERPFPSAEEYEDFVQIENGVGLCALFVKDFEEEVEELLSGRVSVQKGEISSVTGVSAYPLIKSCADRIYELFGVKIHVYEIFNDFFGRSVTVAGLVTGRDIVNQIKDKPKGSRLMLPRCMLKEFGDVLLDNTSVAELQKLLGVPVSVCGTGGADFVRCALDLKEKEQ